MNEIEEKYYIFNTFSNNYFILIKAIRFCDKILPFLLQKMEQNNEKLRIGSLTVIRHLINSSKGQMANKRELVLSGLRPLLTEQNNKVTIK